MGSPVWEPRTRRFEVYDVSKVIRGCISYHFIFVQGSGAYRDHDNNVLGQAIFESGDQGVSSEPVQMVCFNLFDPPVFGIFDVFILCLGNLWGISFSMNFIIIESIFIHEDSIC